MLNSQNHLSLSSGCAGLTQHPASVTLRAKVCEDGHECTFHVEIDSTASEQDDKHLSGNDFDQMKVEFYLIVSPGASQGTSNTFDLTCKNFDESDNHPAAGQDIIATDPLTFQKCLELSTRAVIQNGDGSLEMMVEQNQNRADTCATHAPVILLLFPRVRT